MGYKRTYLILIGLFLAVSLPGCDVIYPDGLLSPTSSLIETIPPATLTAISREAELNLTQLPEPLGIPWTDLDGLELELWFFSDLEQSETGMTAIVDRFNQENEWGITVSAVDQGRLQNPREVVEIAFQEGLVPNLMISDLLPVAGWYDKDYIVDLNPYLMDQAVGFSAAELEDFYPGTMPLYRAEDVRPYFPFTQTIQVMYYNRTWGKELGFSIPPESFDDLYQQACAAASAIQEETDNPEESVGGVILYPDAANLVSWIYAYNGTFYDPESMEFQFSTRETRAVGKDWHKLLSGGCGYTISGYPNPMAYEIEIERFNQREALLIMGSSQLFDHIRTGPNQTGRADDWTMIPFLGPDGDKVVRSDVHGVVIFETTPAEELGSWLFLKYLTGPGIQAEWVMQSGAYPTSKTATRLLRDYRGENPAWAKGILLLRYGIVDPLHPSWELVQLAVGDAYEEILIHEAKDLYHILTQLNQTAQELITYAEND